MNGCFECGSPAKEQHHVVPVSVGGTKTIPLCYDCHGKVHGTRRTRIGELTRAGIQKKKLSGRAYCSTPYGADRVGDSFVRNIGELCVVAEIVSKRKSGESYATIADRLNQKGITSKRGGQWHGSTVYSLLERRAGL